MSRVKLTKIAVERAKPPESGRKEMWDTILPGLHLRITENGTKTYALMARLRGQQFRMNLGRHGAIDLDDARQKARDALELIEKGEDPRNEKRRLRQAPSDAVYDVVEDFIARYVERENRPRSAAESTRALRQRVVPAWKGRSIKSITRRDVIDLLEAIAEDAPATANRTRAVISKLFGWCMDRGILDASPAVRLPAPAPIVERERVLSDKELTGLLEAFDAQGEPFGPFMKMLLLTGQRRTEVATMQWAHIDLDNALWTIPPEHTKANRTHEVPLSPAAVQVLRSMKRRGPYVFTTRTKGDRPVSGYSKAKDSVDVLIARHGEAQAAARPGQTLEIKRRGSRVEIVARGCQPFNPSDDQRIIGICHGTTWGYARITDGNKPILAGRAEARVIVPSGADDASAEWFIGPDPWRLHDLRRTCGTGMARLGIADATISRVLNHAEGGVTRIYRRYSYLEEKRRALDAWGAHIESLIAPKSAKSSASAEGSADQRVKCVESLV